MDKDPNAYENLVDRYLASPQYGERWARHWMDWIRYAESHGSEDDPAIPNAWRYRDYLIRALNNDVPYDQLVLEHLAGDLVSRPRINHDLSLNESAIGPAHLRMVFHGFAPTDALEEQVRFTDDQINVVSQAFMGLTVSCARCHDHKFDPISQADFYAWYGVMASTRPAMVRVDVPPEDEPRRRAEMGNLKTQIKSRLVQAWLNSTGSLRDQLTRPDETLAETLEKSDNDDLLWPIASIRKGHDAFVTQWRKAIPLTAPPLARQDDAVSQWSFNSQHGGDWFWMGPGPGKPAKAGEITIVESGDTVVGSILPAGVCRTRPLMTSKVKAKWNKSTLAPLCADASESASPRSIR